MTLHLHLPPPSLFLFGARMQKKFSRTAREFLLLLSFARKPSLISLLPLFYVTYFLLFYLLFSCHLTRKNSCFARNFFPRVREPLCCAVFHSSSCFPLSITRVSTHLPLSLSLCTVKRGESVNI